MNYWIIALIVGLIVIVGIAAVSFTGYATADKVVSGGCKSCDGKCTITSGCGNPSCTAATTGKCSCGK
ncbi:hypothetical protein FJZ19_03725 [Candidatus Pacearchaeota archaeon]|nr:hypothetical protein [Candidatus Pacearchaeota archaeon]